MTPEKKSESIVNLPPKVKRAIAGGIVAASLATGCGVVVEALPPERPIITSTGIPAKDPKTNTDPTQVAYEFTPTPRVTETMINKPNSIELDLDSIVFPPLSNVKEAYEQGMYEESLKNIDQWVAVWRRMEVFDESVTLGGFKPVLLDGRARISCVSVKSDQYNKILYCPPIDIENGGLRSIPENGKEQEFDRPLIITFQGTEELVTKGSGNEFVYQFMDKYSNEQTRYFDSKTGQIVEGKSLITDVEMVENEIVIEGATGVSAEFLLGGNLRINEEAGRKYYEDFINSLAKNEQNKEYFVGLLGANPDGEKLLEYLRKHDYVLPPGINLPNQRGMPGTIKLGKMPIEESIKLDSLKVVVFGSKEWNSDFGQVREYLYSLEQYNGLWLSSASSSFQYFGWAIDLKDNRLVMVAGSKEIADNKYPHQEKMVVGGYDGNFNYERDSVVASGMLIQINRLLKVYDPNMGTFSHTSVLSSLCGNQETSGVCEKDIVLFFGQGKTMFEPAK